MVPVLMGLIKRLKVSSVRFCSLLTQLQCPGVAACDAGSVKKLDGWRLAGLESPDVSPVVKDALDGGGTGDGGNGSNRGGGGNGGGQNDDESSGSSLTGI